MTSVLAWELRRAPLTCPHQQAGPGRVWSTVVLVACTGLASCNVALQLDNELRLKLHAKEYPRRTKAQHLG